MATSNSRMGLSLSLFAFLSGVEEGTIVLEFVISILLIRRSLLLAEDQTWDWWVNNGIRDGA